MIVDQTETAPDAALTTATPRPRSALRKIFSFPVVLGALLVVLTVFTVRGRFNDPDMWWHLKTGEIIWNTHHIPTVDEFSFTTNHHAYIPQEWLSQLTIYAAYHFGGYVGLMLWLCLFASLISVFGYVLCWLYSGNSKVAFIGALSIWLFSTVGLAIRPQLIGYLLLICELLIIYLGRTRHPNCLLLLPPLFALWVNCHGSFLLGMIVLGAVLLCAFCNFHAGLLLSRCWGKRPRTTLLLAFTLSAAALFINPVGLAQVTYPLNTMFSQHIGLTYSSEWQPAPPNDIRVWALLGLAGLMLLAPSLRRVELELQELLLLAVGFALGFQHERLLFVSGILMAPGLCRLLSTAWDAYQPDRDRPLPNAVLLTIAACVIALTFPSARNLAGQVDKANPVKALDYIKHSGLSGRMLNEYVYGGYLIWAAPNRKVFVDGRADIYEWTGVLRDYMSWITLQSDPSSILRKYRIDYCLLSRHSGMSRVMRLLPRWRPVYSDTLSIVFARVPGASPEHK